MIYFIHNETMQAIKIGVSDNPEKRMAGLQTACPHRLELLATMEGSYPEEKILHERFDVFRLDGEWFSTYEPNDTVLEFVTGINLVKRALRDWINKYTAYPKLNYLVSAAVGHEASVFWIGDGAGSEGSQYQVMRYSDGPGPGFEFWQWHVVNHPPYYHTPEDACVAYVDSFRRFQARREMGVTVEGRS